MWRFDQGTSFNTNQFQNVFWSFGQLVEGFYSCRLVISIADIHRYNKCRSMKSLVVSIGTLVVVSFVFAIVEGETNHN